MTKNVLFIGIIAANIVTTGVISAVTEFTKSSHCQEFLRSGAKLSDRGYSGFVKGPCCRDGRYTPCSEHNYCIFACHGKNHLAHGKSKTDCLACCEKYSKTKSRPCPKDKTPAPETITDKKTCKKHGYFWEHLTGKCKKG